MSEISTVAAEGEDAARAGLKSTFWRHWFNNTCSLRGASANETAYHKIAHQRERLLMTAMQRVLAGVDKGVLFDALNELEKPEWNNPFFSGDPHHSSRWETIRKFQEETR